MVIFHHGADAGNACSGPFREAIIHFCQVTLNRRGMIVSFIPLRLFRSITAPINLPENAASFSIYLPGCGLIPVAASIPFFLLYLLWTTGDLAELQFAFCRRHLRLSVLSLNFRSQGDKEDDGRAYRAYRSYDGCFCVRLYLASGVQETVQSNTFTNAQHMSASVPFPYGTLIFVL